MSRPAPCVLETSALVARALEHGDTPIVTEGGRPVGVVVPLATVLEAGAAAGTAAWLLSTGAVSIGTAATLAGLSVAGMIDLVGKLGYRDVFYDEERLAGDLRALSRL